MKFSEEKDKITLPSAKSVLRLYNEDGKPILDLLCLQDEEAHLVEQAGKEVEYFKTRAEDCPASKIVPHKIELITNPLFQTSENTPMAERRE